MSLFTENIVPGKTGKVFGTDTRFLDDLLLIKDTLLSIDGIKNVEIHGDIYPKELIIFSDKLISVALVENVIKKIGFHLIPKGVV